MNSLKDFKNYKVVIFTLDDIVFNLNQIRYDFSQLLYPNIFKHITYHEYTLKLGTIQSMYSFLNADQAKQINNKIESFLYSEQNLKNIKINENVEAVFNLLKSKNIKIVLFTTHSSKRAKQLLKYKGLLNSVDQVVSISDYSNETPSIKLFHTVIDLYETNHYELLVVSSLNSIFKCIRYSPIDSIYIHISKLATLENNLKPTATINDLFELLQYILFGKYTNTDIYNNFLDYDEKMSEEEKHNRYQYLKIKYTNTAEISPIVTEIFSENNNIKYGDFDTQEFSFHFKELSKNSTNPILKQETIFDQPIEHTKIFEPINNNEFKKRNTLPFETKNDIDTNTTHYSIPYTETIINQKSSNITDLYEPKVQSDSLITNVKEDKKHIFATILSSVILSTVNSILIISSISLVYMAFESWINQYWLLKAICDIFILGYANLCLWLFDMPTFIPNSTQIIPSFTPLFNQFLIIILITSIILSICSIIRNISNEQY